MDDSVNITIDGVPVTVPNGTVVVDAAKRIENNIPVFCYHPKMEPVGMCRMCLVEVGMPIRDRATGEMIKDEDGNPKINFGPVLQTGCTVRVAEGMVVRTNTNLVSDSRDDIIEFLLTSHPLDCPICDKGGECPLQNLTMRYGPGTTRFDFSDKLKQDKHVALGELINLDRERCIQCARCTRFQAEIVDDPVIAFHNRGRHLEIVTLSSPGFDSYWSGNTTDICPVGALTTTDFRFGARPWELTPVASICPHCPVGCNTTMSTRQEAKSDGRTVIKRIMPRQNERVNEIWICDKGRFVHHFASSSHRLTKPLVREGDELVERTWDEALDLVAGKLQIAKSKVAGLTNSSLSNEDLFQFQKLFRKGLDSNNIDLINREMAGGDVISRVGISSGSNLRDLGQGDAILVVATDLHEEAPVWWLRAKQAAERGAILVVANLRSNRLDKFATHTIQYEPGKGLKTIYQLLNAAKVDAPASQQDSLQIAAESLIEAKNLIIFYGREGLSFSETGILARLLANLLLVKQQKNDDGSYHAGRKNNGLIAVWPHGNTQGTWDMGLHPSFGPGYESLSEPGFDAEEILRRAVEGEIDTLYLAGADPIGDGRIESRGDLDFLIVQELFMTETANQADVVLPAQSWAEREGTFTNGERRVQRYYPALHPVGESRADWKILCAWSGFPANC
jgi:NADH-quinone oxidoreductase subunit G